MIAAVLLIICGTQIHLLFANEFQCPAESGNFANPEDCNSYYACDHGDAVLMQCPSGLYFDTTYKICNNPTVVTCNLAPTTQSTRGTTEPDANNPTTERTSPTTSSTTSRPNDDQITCPSSGKSLLENSKDCTTFYYCQNGNSFLISCPIKFIFNPVDGLCVEGNDCIPGSSTDKPPYVPDCSMYANGAVLPNINDCSSYFICSNGLAILSECPLGLEFNAQAKVCDNPQSANCVD